MLDAAGNPEATYDNDESRRRDQRARVLLRLVVLMEVSYINDDHVFPKWVLPAFNRIMA